MKAHLSKMSPVQSTVVLPGVMRLNYPLSFNLFNYSFNYLTFIFMFQALIKCLEDRGFFILLTSSALIPEPGKDKLSGEKILMFLFLFHKINNLHFFCPDSYSYRLWR